MFDKWREVKGNQELKGVSKNRELEKSRFYRTVLYRTLAQAVVVSTFSQKASGRTWPLNIANQGELSYPMIKVELSEDNIEVRSKT